MAASSRPEADAHQRQLAGHASFSCASGQDGSPACSQSLSVRRVRLHKRQPTVLSSSAGCTNLWFRYRLRSCTSPALAGYTALPYYSTVLTVAETAIFVRYAAEVWSDAEREAFISWIAANPSAGDVIPGSGGCRKVRWMRQGQGKRGGARVIYFVESSQTIWLLIVYAKAKFDSLPAEFLAELKRGVEDEY